MIKYILTILLFTQTVFATCPEDIQVIKKGEVANCDGLLLSKKASEDVANTKAEAEHYRKLSDLLYKRRELTNKEISILDKRIKLYMEQSHTLATELYKKEKENKWQKFLYFGLGVLATGVAVYGASQIAR